MKNELNINEETIKIIRRYKRDIKRLSYENNIYNSKLKNNELFKLKYKLK